MFKKIPRLVISLGLATCIGAGLSVGCSKKSDNLLPTTLAHYDGTHYGEYSDKYPEYNPELWRSNAGPSTRNMPNVEDPAVFDNTSHDGYFYLANKRGGDWGYYRSTDLENWEKGGVNVKIHSSSNTELHDTDYLWAPEYTYDEADGGWYYFFTTMSFDNSKTMHVPVVFRSRSMTGDFEIVNFKDEESCGKLNLHDYDKTAYPQYFAKYALFQPDKYRAAREKEAERTGATFLAPDSTDSTYNNGYMLDIDLHPFVDPITKEKYLYMSTTPYSIGVMRMVNWLQPDYESYRILTYAEYYTVADYTAEKNGATVEKVSYEQMGNTCNEGPHVTYHNGKYYLTYSINHYQESCYAVMQAVSDKPTGPFRKLTDAENGLLISSDMDDNKFVSGTGHHSFINYKVNGQDKLYIAYHSHDDIELKGGARHTNVDEIKWVTIEDKDGNSLEVMHVNGPTVTAQPTFGINKQYLDISEDAKVSLESGKIASGSSLKWINDGLIGFNNLTCQEFEDKYVGETVISETSTFKIAFDTARTVRGFMVYNSKHGGVNDEKDYFFERVKNIRIVCEEDGEEKTYTISKLDVDKKAATLFSEFAGITTLEGVARGYGVYAEFNELSVKSITFTVEKPAGKSAVAIPEISVVGKPATDGTDDNFVNDYTYSNQFEYTDSKLKADGGVNVDGVLDEEFYGSKKWITARCVNAGSSALAGLDQTAKYTIHFSETGFVFAAEVHGNWPVRSLDYDTGNTTCIESYFGFDGIDAMCEIDMTADGRFRISEFKNPVSIMTFDLETKPLYRTTLFDKNENGEYTGYNCEAFVPYSLFGIDKAPEVVYSDVTLINWNVDERGLGTDKVWYSIASNQSTIAQDSYKRGFMYDKDGFISYKLDITEVEGGRVEERFGYDYIVPTNVTQLKIIPDSGMQITGLTVNGEDRIGDLYTDNNGELVCDVTGTGDLQVVPEFCRLSDNYIVSTIAADGASYSGFAEEVAKTGVLTGKVTGATVYGVSINGVFAPVSDDGSVSINVADLGLYEHVGLLKVKALTSDTLKDCNITANATGFDGLAMNIVGKTVTLASGGISYPITVGEGGKLNVAKLPAGEYTLSGYGLADAKITVDGNALNLNLTQSSVYSHSGRAVVENKADDTVVTITGNGEADYFANSYAGSFGVVAESSENMSLTANIKIKKQEDWKASRIAFFFTDDARDGLMLFTMQNGGGEFNVYRTNSYKANDESGGRVMVQSTQTAQALYGALASSAGLNVKFVRIGATLGLSAYLDGKWTYLGNARLGTDNPTAVSIYACGNEWEISQIRSEALTYHEEVKATPASPNGNFAYVESASGDVYNAYGKPSSLDEMNYVYGDPQIINGEVEYTKNDGKLTITEHGVPSQYKDCSVEARLFPEEELINSTEVSVTVTVKSVAKGEWYARRFGIAVTDDYDGFMFFLAGGSESNVFTMANSNLDDDRRTDVSRLLSANDYADKFAALNGEGLKLKIVRSGGAITLFAEIDGSFVKLTQTQLRSADAKTQISFLATGDTWEFSDITVERN